MKPVVGFVGLGTMGQPMCANILKAGYEVWAYDADPDKTAAMVSQGAYGGTGAAQVCQASQWVVIMVPGNEHVEAVVGEMLPFVGPEKVIIDMSTISPSVSRRLAAEVAQRGGVMVDAPVVKSRPAAVAGELGILVGGPADTVETITPLLRSMGKNIIRMGDNGAGLVMKLCHNMLVAQIQYGVNEMLALAEAAGLDIDDVITAVSYGGGKNFYLDSKASAIKSQDFTPAFALEHMAKDIALTGALARELGVRLKGCSQVAEVMVNALEQGLGKEDFSATIKVVREMVRSHE